VCGSKTFYDANLNYDDGPSELAIPPFKIAGGDLQSWGYRLDYLGDWAVLCHRCAKTHRTQIVPLAAATPSAGDAS
jgi:hypothetical protein